MQSLKTIDNVHKTLITSIGAIDTWEMSDSQKSYYRAEL